MKAVFCKECKAPVTSDEVALNQRLLGMQIGAFYCTDCLAGRLHTTSGRLRMLISRFKEMGCAYFTRLVEEPANENANDSV